MVILPVSLSTCLPLHLSLSLHLSLTTCLPLYLSACSFRLVPFLTELRAVMDWVWTDTTLSLSSWICVEDVYAHSFVLKCWRESEKVGLIILDYIRCVSMCILMCNCVCIIEYLCIICMHSILMSTCVYLYSAVPAASWAEEKACGEVWDGRSDCSAADLHRLVSTTLHVAHQVCCRSRQPSAGRLSDHHTGRFPGNTPVLTHLH